MEMPKISVFVCYCSYEEGDRDVFVPHFEKCVEAKKMCCGGDARRECVYHGEEDETV